VPRFQINGFGRESGKRRSRVYSAADEEAARAIAFNDGTVIESISEMPPDLPQPATESQKNYAEGLGIEFDPSITKSEISVLIAERVKADNETGSFSMNVTEDGALAAAALQVAAELVQTGLPVVPGTIKTTADFERHLTMRIKTVAQTAAGLLAQYQIEIDKQAAAS
jgi:hypothetical protein